MNAEQLALLAMKKLGIEQKQQSVPAKKHTKKHGKMQNTFLNNLVGVPGGGFKVGTYWWYQKMIDAVETGCRVASSDVESRLNNSPQNSNTTQGNYNRKV